MRYKIHITLIITSLLIFSCTLKTERVKKDVYLMPSIYRLDNETDNLHKFGMSKKLKLILFLNGDCMQCLADLIEFENNINNYKDKNLASAVIVHTENSILAEFNLRKFKSQIPIYLDTCCDYLKYNNIEDFNNHILLLDSTNSLIYTNINNKKRHIFSKELHNCLTNKILDYEKKD